MGSEVSPGEPTTRRYSAAEKEQAVRLVRQLRAELGTEQGTVHRIARQLGYGPESVRSWVRRADIDESHIAGVSTIDASWIAELEQENRELKRANEMAHSTGGCTGPVRLGVTRAQEQRDGRDPHS